MYSLKTSENLWFPDVFRGCRNGILAGNGFLSYERSNDALANTWHYFIFQKLIYIDIVKQRYLQVKWPCLTIIIQAIFKDCWLTLYAPIPQNGQTHSNKSSPNCRRILWVCLTILWSWQLNWRLSDSSKFVPVFLRAALL